MGMAFGSVVTILRPSSTEPDHFGTITATISRIDVKGCGIAPRYSSDVNELGHSGVIIGLTLLAPPGTVIRSTDTIELYGGGTVSNAPVTPNTAVVYGVEGEPGTWVNPLTGTAHGVEVALKLAVG
jgi:hypothetical protein